MTENKKTPSKEILGNSEFHFYIPNENDFEIASWLSAEITSSLAMLPKSQEEILFLFHEGRSVVILDDKNQPVAHAAISLLYESSRVIEIGGVLVDSSARRKGLGSAAVLGAIALGRENYPNWYQMALCNQTSLPLFLKLGAKELDMETALNIVPKEAWEACSTCPNLNLARSQGKVCCDTPVSLENIKLNINNY